MARNRAIVDVVIRITPPVERPTARALEKTPDGFLIEFRGGATARVLAGERAAAAMLDLLDDLRQQKAPVYVEVGEERDAIALLMIPTVTQIEEVREVADGGIDVVLSMSHARHRLERKNEEFTALLEALLQLSEKDQWALVTETDRHEIIDVRPLQREDIPAGYGPPTFLARLWAVVWDRWLFNVGRRWAVRVCSIFCCPPRLSCCISLKRAWDMFLLVAPTTCNPLDPQAPCIPFLYPDDGCWGRAHEMCRLMIAAGVKPSKVWIQGSLTVATKNNPYCAVGWNWHVAPTLCVRTRWCFHVTYVIDPSLFSGPVTVATWKSVQGDPAATLTYTSSAIFHLQNETDPTYTKTAGVLATYRNKLKQRSTVDVNPNTNMLWGPPPYAHC
jgi:Glutaminase